MKLNEVFDRGEIELHNAIASQPWWLLDAKTKKKLAGPFKDQDKAASFKKNRTDRIPQDALIRSVP